MHHGKSVAVADQQTVFGDTKIGYLKVYCTKIGYLKVYCSALSTIEDSPFPCWNLAQLYDQKCRTYMTTCLPNFLTCVLKN